MTHIPTKHAHSIPMNVRLLIFAAGPQSNLRKGVFETDVQLWYRSGKIGMNRCAQKYHNRTSVLGPDGFIRSGKSGIMEAPGRGLTNAHRFFRRDALLDGPIRAPAGASQPHTVFGVWRLTAAHRFRGPGKVPNACFQGRNVPSPVPGRASWLYRNGPAIFLHPAAVMNA